MPTVQETAYLRLKSAVTEGDLVALFTPAPQEIALAQRATRSEIALLGFLVLMKTFQRLGHFVLISQVPILILEHIAAVTQTTGALPELTGYDVSGTRFRQIPLIREALGINPYGKAARHEMLLSLSEAARTKEELVDLVNVAIEELVRLKYELPAFDTLVRAARHARAALYRQFHRQVEDALSAGEKAALETLFVPEGDSRFTPWNTLKQEPGRPTLTHLKDWLDRRAWLAEYRVGEAALRDLPPVKIHHFAAEARTLDAARMLALEPRRGGPWRLPCCACSPRGCWMIWLRC